MRTSAKHELKDVLCGIDAYFVETAESHYSDSGHMWELAMNARAAIARVLADVGVVVAEAPWQGE